MSVYLGFRSMFTISSVLCTFHMMLFSEEGGKPTVRYILLSADSQPILYEAPEAVALQLRYFADQFLEEINRLDSSFWRHLTDPNGEKYDCLAYTVDDFVAWLNKQPETQYRPVKKAEHLHMEEQGRKND